MSQPASQTGTPGGLRGDEAAFFQRHHDALLRTVRRAVNASPALIEDACATAWAIFLRRQPDRDRQPYGWLCTVAIHEAYKLSRAERSEARLEDLTRASQEGGNPDAWQARIASDHELDDALEARRALRLLAQLPERQRRYLALSIAGYHYHEIARLTGATYTNVNTHLTKARARIRALEQAA